MKVAVTGSNGLIGKILVQKLRGKKFEVAECSRQNCDVLNPKQVEGALKGAKIVVHCAAQLEEEAHDIFDINVKGTENVLEAAAKNNAEQFIFLSSVGVYGPVPGLKDEKTESRAETNYEKSKLEAEKKVLSFQEVFHTTIMRPAIVVGRNRYWKKIIATIRKGFPLPGSGKNKWQMVCAEDVAEAIIFCIAKEECFGETFIVAENEESLMTLEELVNFARKELGLKGGTGKIPLWIAKIMAFLNSFIKIIPLLTPSYLARMQRERAYSTKKLEALGWKAKRSGKECLKELVKNF